MTPALPKVSFGMIVLNGLPYLPYNLRALYPFAHQIIVVEGAAPGAAGIATANGHSRDGTLQELRRFAREEDPDDKLVVVTAEDCGHENGFWPGEKDEQSCAYAVRATGEYLWQVDVDEFYLDADMRRILARLLADPTISAVTFPTLTFWGDPGVVADSWYLRRGAADYHRLFKWGPGYTYVSHRPPTVCDDLSRDTRSVNWLDARAVARMGIAMYHYSLLLPLQVTEKVDYYYNGLYRDLTEGIRRWLADSYLTLRRPYRVHNVYRYPSWLQRFDGPHPCQIEHMMADIVNGTVTAALRPPDDAECLLRSPKYRAGRELLKLAEPLDRWRLRVRQAARSFVRRTLRRTPRSGGEAW